MRLWCSGLLLIATLALPQTTSPQGAQSVPRTILVLYDGTFGEETKFLPVHQIMEMPLNHLGLKVRYRDLRSGLPPLDQLKDVRGVLTWFRADAMTDPLGFLRWSEAAIDSGKKMVIIGDLSVTRDLKNKLTPLSAMNRLWAKLGLYSSDNWTSITYDWKIVVKDSRMVEFERALPRTLPTFLSMKRIDSTVKSYLSVRHGNDPNSDNDLVVVGKNGGYVSGNFVLYSTPSETRNRLWYLNPFEFFRAAFATDDLPKPDTTTLVGRRIFYSHIDGDGWRNGTEVMPYRKERKLSPYVIMKEVIEAFPDLPITVAPIAADLDPAWHGTPETAQLARDIFKYKNVEPASHTYAHPLAWGSLTNKSKAVERPSQSKQTPTIAGTDTRYEQPLSYMDQPFDLNREIRGSVEFINRFAPPGKRVKLLQWSGDAIPFEAAVAATRNAGLRNINGGDTRMDPEFPSYAWVAPTGLQSGEQQQIYASGSNENTYTHLWTDRFFGFRFLTRTLKNTDTPIRIKPHNIYYHMYSGDKLPGLVAVVENYKYARTQEIAPVTAARFAAVADGFYSTTLTPLGPATWRVDNRDGLQTIRFDRATLQTVDFEKSSGVLGQRQFQGSLYVALDPEVGAPVIALKPARTIEELPSSTAPYLVESRWEISGLQRTKTGFSFDAWGYGAGDSTWRVPVAGRYAIRIRKAKGAISEAFAQTESNQLLKLRLGQDGIDKVHVDVVIEGAAAR